MLTVVTGATWGDEDKEQIVNLMARRHKIVVRYQGGSHKGYHYQDSGGQFTFRLLPPGVLYQDSLSILADGMMIDLDQLRHEISMADFFGLHIDPDHLKLSQRATVCMPCHARRDVLDEERADRLEVSAAASDKYRKNTLRLGDLLFLDEPSVRIRLRTILDSENVILDKVYNQPKIREEEVLHWCRDQAAFFRPYICSTGEILRKAQKDGTDILMEAQSGTLCDIDYGVFPYTVPTNTIAAYAGIGAGIPEVRPDRVVSALGAYSKYSGSGPFPAGNAAVPGWEGSLNEEKDRGIRSGPFDSVAARYGLQCQGTSRIVMTGLKQLSAMKSIPIITAYRTGGKISRDFPTGVELERVAPVIEMVPGWQCSLDGCTCWEELPAAAKGYVRRIEQEIDRHIDQILLDAENGYFPQKQDL